VVPRARALGWRKTHFGHPDIHVRQALGLGLNVSEPTERFDFQVPGWMLGWHSMQV